MHFPKMISPFFYSYNLQRSLRTRAQKHENVTKKKNNYSILSFLKLNFKYVNFVIFIM